MREQKQSLNNVKGTEVQQGQLSSGVTQGVNLSPVQQAPTSGQRLAQSLNLALGATQKVVGVLADDINESEAAFQSIEGNASGTRYALDVVEQAKKLPLEDQSAYIRGKMEIGLNNMKGTNVSKSFLKSYINAFSQNASAHDAAVNKQIYENQIAITKLKTSSNIVTMSNAGESQGSIMKMIMSANKTLTRPEAGELYVKSISSSILDNVRKDPTYDYKTAIDTKLKIVSEDGSVNYAQHPVYGALIRNLEDNIKTLNTARTESDDKVKKAQAVESTKNILNTLYNPDASAEDILAAKTEISKNQSLFTVEQYKTLNSALKDAVDTTGYAKVSDPAKLTQIKASIIKGDLNLSSLSLLQSTMSKADYKEAASLILKQEEEDKKAGVTQIKDGLKDLESTGVKRVAQQNALGSFLSNKDAENADAFKKEWNSYLITYTQQNQTLPSYEEAAKKQEEIINKINKANNAQPSWATLTSETTNAPTTVDEILKTGNKDMIQQAIRSNVISQEALAKERTRILKQGDSKTIKDALDRGIISPGDMSPQASNGFSLFTKAYGSGLPVNKADALIASVFKAEGGYSDDPTDKGNFYKKKLIGTNHGISAPILAEYLHKTPTKKDMQNLTTDEARHIYKTVFYDKFKINQIPNDLQEIVFHGVVNSGSHAIKVLQELAGVKADGIVGDKTLAAIKNANISKQQFKDALLAKYKTFETWKTYGAGWTNRFEALANK